jgi:DNA repair protein RecO
MLEKTQGIVLERMPYLESSLIVRILTYQFGLRSYIIKGVRKQGKHTSSFSQISGNLFQPLFILDLVVYENNEDGLNNIKEVKPVLLSNMSSDINKATVAFFLADVICKCVRAKERDINIYSFLRGQIEQLDTLNSACEEFVFFPQRFLCAFASYLGYQMMNNYSTATGINPFFDMQKGHFVSEKEANNSFNVLKKEDSVLLSAFLAWIYEGEKPIEFSSGQRRRLLELILQFYYTHILQPNSLKSYPVLVSLLH